MSLPSVNDLRCNVRFSAVQDATFRDLLAQRRLQHSKIEAEYMAAKLALEHNSREMEILVAAIAPIRSIPEDVLLEIFGRCIDEEASDDLELYLTLDSSRCPLLLTHVCAHWRSVAIGTPRLWERIFFRSPGLPSDLDALKIILRRSQVPTGRLQVTVHSSDGVRRRDNMNILMALTRLDDFCIRLSTLALRCRTDHLREMLRQHTISDHHGAEDRVLGPAFPALSAITMDLNKAHDVHLVEVLCFFRNSPALHSLAFDSAFGRIPDRVRLPGDSFFSPDFEWLQLTRLTLSTHCYASVGEVVDLFTCCTNLEELTLDADLWVDYDSDAPTPLTVETTPKCLLPFLHTLAHPRPESLGVLVFLTTPALRHLSLNTVAWDEILDFQARSEFSLESLEVEDVWGTGNTIVQLLERCPDIWRISLHDLGDDDQANIVRNLEYEESGADGDDSDSVTPVVIVPRLRELTLGLAEGMKLQNNGKLMQAMLQSRCKPRGELHTGLECVRVVVGKDSWEARGDNILRRLKELPLSVVE
ncbi:hypothetical protein C8F01DRAFT_1145413 [Mycena amicta]|nr:hypothetical protein C8F01DRAFT_1145413 [Mycena amicta]